jgi:hypothetical protein
MVVEIHGKPYTTMMESNEAWARRIGSKGAMRTRIYDRQRGVINRPVPGVRGLANLALRIETFRKDGTKRRVAKMTIGHAWACECVLCRPWMWSDSHK